MHELRPDVPFRKNFIHRQILYIRGEAFVKPKVSPPLHSDKIAEPLVSQFVSNNESNPLLSGRRRPICIKENSGFPISYRSPILHSPGSKVRDSYHIQDRQGIFDAEIIFVKSQRLNGDLQSKIGLFFLSRSYKDSHHSASGGFLF